MTDSRVPREVWISLPSLLTSQRVWALAVNLAWAS